MTAVPPHPATTPWQMDQERRMAEEANRKQAEQEEIRRQLQKDEHR